MYELEQFVSYPRVSKVKSRPGFVLKGHDFVVDGVFVLATAERPKRIQNDNVVIKKMCICEKVIMVDVGQRISQAQQENAA